jgi:hypothetical protein
MARPTAHDLVRLARHAGYQVLSIEQLRPNRWLLMLIEPPDRQVILFVQVRPLVSSGDVQDFAQLAGAPAQRRGILLAYQGTFTPDARRRHCQSAAVFPLSLLLIVQRFCYYFAINPNFGKPYACI